MDARRLMTAGRNVLKRTATMAGAHLPARVIKGIEATGRYILLGRRLEDLGIRFQRRLGTREAVFGAVASTIAGQKVLYLEFGVYMGASMRWWAAALDHPGSRLYGFDSFEGLPEGGGSWSQGQFDTGQRIPEISDDRVRFIKGWFEETLPSFEVPTHDRLVLNLDADLYSSTVCVLSHLKCHVRPGTLIYFDELDQVDQELRALEEFVIDSGRQFRGVAAHTSLAHAFIECIG